MNEGLGHWYHSCATNKTLNSSSPGQNSRHFANDLFICIFVNEKFCQNRQQGIIWTNAAPVHWHIYAALEGDEFTLCVWKIYLSHTWVRYPGFWGHGVKCPILTTVVPGFPAIWLAVPFGANGAHLGICTLPEKIFFVCEISCFWVK